MQYQRYRGDGRQAALRACVFGRPGNLSWAFVRDLYKGMDALARESGIAVVGGDTIKSAKLVINVALAGEANKADVVYRSGARPGDLIFVTGPLGKSLSTGWHLKFVPRVKKSRYLVRRVKPTAMIDISDGLAADLGHILEESKVGAVLEEKGSRGARVPVCVRPFTTARISNFCSRFPAARPLY